MADTYEKDLGQKSSLTTRDFIRVVGSDNVSYKQGMASVMGAMGVDGLMMPSNIIPSGSTVETYANGLSKGFHLACNNSSSTATAQGAPFTCPCTYYITVYTVNEHIQIICQPWNPNVANSKTLAVKTKYGGTWSDWTIMPTRAEVEPQLTTLTALGKAWDFYKIGRLVVVSAYTDSQSTSAGWNEIGTLPTAYRPTTQTYLKVQNATGNMFLVIYRNGDVRFYNGGSATSSAANCGIGGSYIAVQ